MNHRIKMLDQPKKDILQPNSLAQEKSHPYIQPLSNSKNILKISMKKVPSKTSSFKRSTKILFWMTIVF